jgi:hypothetical protein
MATPISGRWAPTIMKAARERMPISAVGNRVV